MLRNICCIQRSNRMVKISITDQHLEEAILGVVSSIDKPLSPVGEAKNDFNFNLRGYLDPRTTRDETTSY